MYGDQWRQWILLWYCVFLSINHTSLHGHLPCICVNSKTFSKVDRGKNYSTKIRQKCSELIYWSSCGHSEGVKLVRAKFQHGGRHGCDFFCRFSEPKMQGFHKSFLNSLRQSSQCIMEGKARLGHKRKSSNTAKHEAKHRKTVEKTTCSQVKEQLSGLDSKR